MANTVNTLTESLKLFYEEQVSPAIVDFINLFFPEVFTTDAKEIPVDQIVDTRTLAGYRAANGASNVLKYNAGSGTYYDPPTVALKTPVSEDLAGSVTVGMSPNDPVSMQLLAKYGRIQSQQARRIYTTIAKQGMDILVSGSFQPIDGDGNNVGAAISFGRAAGNSLSAAYAANPVGQLTAGWDVLDAQGCPAVGRFALVGADVLARLEANTDFQKSLEMQSVNNGNVFLSGETMPNRAVVKIVEFKIPKRAGRITICAFPEYYVDNTGTSQPYVPAKGVVMGSFASPRTQAYGGIYITDTSDNTGEMYEGQIISDRYVAKDPDGLVLRSQSRPLLVPGIVNHTAYVLSTD